MLRFHSNRYLSECWICGRFRIIKLEWLCPLRFSTKANWQNKEWELHTGCIIRFPWYCMRRKLESEIRRKWRPWWERTLHLCCCLLNEWWPCSRLLHRREASPWTRGTRHVPHPHVLVGWSWRRGWTIHLQIVLLQHLRIVQCLLNSFQLESQVVLVLDSATKYSMKSNSKQRHYHATNAKFHYRKLLVLKGGGNFKMPNS